MIHWIASENRAATWVSVKNLLVSWCFLVKAQDIPESTAQTAFPIIGIVYWNDLLRHHATSNNKLSLPVFLDPFFLSSSADSEVTNSGSTERAHLLESIAGFKNESARFTTSFCFSFQQYDREKPYHQLFQLFHKIRLTLGVGESILVSIPPLVLLLDRYHLPRSIL